MYYIMYLAIMGQNHSFLDIYWELVLFYLRLRFMKFSFGLTGPTFYSKCPGSLINVSFITIISGFVNCLLVKMQLSKMY